MVRSCAHYRQTCGEVNSGIESQGLEGDESLVVVHGQDSIEVVLLVGTEKSVRGVGPECQDVLAARCLDGRTDDVYLCASEQTAVSGMRIESEHGYLGPHDTEILHQGLVHDADLTENLLHRQGAGHRGQRQVVGHYSHSHLAGHHEHHAVTSSALLGQILGMTDESGQVQGHVLLVQRCRDQSIQVSGHQIPDRCLQRDQRSLCPFGRGLSGINAEIVRHAVDDIDPLGMKVLGGIDDVGIEILHFGELLLVEAECPRGAIDDRDAEIQEACICQRLDNHLIAYSIRITLGDSYNNFPIHGYKFCGPP